MVTPPLYDRLLFAIGKAYIPRIKYQKTKGKTYQKKILKKVKKGVDKVWKLWYYEQAVAEKRRKTTRSEQS